MEARTILLTSMVFGLWTSTTTGQNPGFCIGKVDGPYCEHCLQPVQCLGGVSTIYSPCEEGTACIVAFEISFCASHTETDCACTGAGVQCDAFMPGYIEHCDASGPTLVSPCPSAAPTCYNGECLLVTCPPGGGWTLMPECTGTYYCNAFQAVEKIVDCEDDEYVDSAYGCSPAPPPACDGSCAGRCPNPVDCQKFFICQGTTAIGSGSCVGNQFFDINTNECSSTFTCTHLNGCNFEVGISTTSDGPTTTAITTTTDEVIYTVPPAVTCNSSTVGSRYPYASCSKQYCVCTAKDDDQYEYIVATCLGDLFFSTDPANPYCDVTCL